MNRREFTDNITILVREMVEDKEQPILDYILRSAEEQRRLFDKGLSRCDGTTNKSNHQKGLAADIYLCESDVTEGVRVNYDWNRDKAKRWHDRWEELGGKPVIEWDLPHFEG